MYVLYGMQQPVDSSVNIVRCVRIIMSRTRTCNYEQDATREFMAAVPMEWETPYAYKVF